MTTVQSATSTSTTASGTPGTTATNSAGTNLGENDFLQLMMDQLKNQDPLSPSDPTQYLGELAQFTTLEQMTNVAQNSSTSAASQQGSAALALLGHKVSYIDSNGNSQSGTVQQVDMSTSGGPTLTVNGISGVTPSSVNEVS
jgi:flagellar basal-body rod modification protein FlgD